MIKNRTEVPIAVVKIVVEWTQKEVETACKNKFKIIETYRI